MDTIGPEGRQADQYDQCYQTIEKPQYDNIDDSKAYLSSLFISNTQDLYMSYWGLKIKNTVSSRQPSERIGNTTHALQSSTIPV